MVMVAELPSVYAIVHRATDRKYIGSASNTSKRWSRHRADLRRNKHPNKHLQSAWNKYGEDAFDWIVLAHVPLSGLIELEQRYIDMWEVCNPIKGFNKEPIAGRSSGNAAAGWSEERKISQSATMKAMRPTETICRKCGAIKDGSYTKKRPNGSIRIICQECARRDARDRARLKRGDAK